MSGGIIAAAVAPHVPRIGIEERAPEFSRGLISGLKEMGGEIRALKPDVIVLISAHWVSSFNWYVTAQADHKGVCIADEAPDLFPGEPYHFKGAPTFARALQENIASADIPCHINDSPHFDWDYASYIPLKYMTPDSNIPIILLPSVICSSLEEGKKVGEIVYRTAKEQNQRVVFITSSALSHKILRGPDLWPTEERRVLDKKFMDLFLSGKIDEIAQWLPDFTREGKVEMGGMPMSTLIGVMMAMQQEHPRITTRQFGTYAQSSGSGNVNLLAVPQ